MVAIELTAFEAMQVQTALAERMARLSRVKPNPRHEFEASVVASGLSASTSALSKVTDALYPDEPVLVELPGWTEAEKSVAWGR